MKITIDEEQCRNKNIPLDVLLYLISMKLGYPINQETFKKAWENGYIICHESDYRGNIIKAEICKEGLHFIDENLGDASIEDKGDRFTNLATKLIELYPKGKKDGTSYMWRDSKSIIAKRLKSLVSRYKVEFTDEQAIKATERYVKSFNGNYQFMQLLKYFISKTIIVDGRTEEVSQLLSYIENEDSENINNDWTTRLV